MTDATVIETVDTKYKDGDVTCRKCGWSKHFGDGFNKYVIKTCPNCDTSVTLRIQNTVTTGRPGNYTISRGTYRYFVMSNGIHVQFDGTTYVRESRSRLPR
jgi:hypothetical protein